MRMKKNLLLLLTALTFSVGAWSQMVDVTSQYIPNADFEACEALPTVPYHDNQKNVDILKVELYQESSVAKGYDYAAQGWKLVEQQTAVNGGVITYNCNVQTGKWATAGEPGPGTGVTGAKGLCFVGNKGLVYQQTDEITLPAGIYRLTVNLYARNGQTTNPGPTQQVVNIKTGFMPTGGIEDDLIPAMRNSAQFASNAWATDVLDIELTKATTGRFQISYGTSYYVVVDDVKLEYQSGVVTTALSNVLTKAKALNAELNSSRLSAAIQAAEDFIANPTAQEDVPTQVDVLYAAMSTALEATTKPVNITAAYLENASFETGKMEPWESYGSVNQPVNELSMPYIDGKYVMEYTQATASNTCFQTASHLPAGYYLLDAKLNSNASLVMGTVRTDCTGGVDYLYLRVPSGVRNIAAGELKVGVRGTKAYRVDDFRLFYGKDEESLRNVVLQDVKADAQAVLDDAQYAGLTGTERTQLATAISGTDIAAINAAVNAFVSASAGYAKLTKAKETAATYTKTAYPYGLTTLYDQIQTLIVTEAASSTQASEMATQLDNLCYQFYVSNFYCEGVAKVDYSGSITRYGASNMAVRTDKTAWKDPKTGEVDADAYVFGVKTDYVSASKDNTSLLRLTLSGDVPAGIFVVAMTMMGSTDLPVDVYTGPSTSSVAKIGTIVGKGTVGGGKYGLGWNDYAIEFNRYTDDTYIFLQCKPTANYKEWYVGNFRIYYLTDATTGINTPKREVKADNHYYDLQGRRVEQSGKGLYILNGKKIVIK